MRYLCVIALIAACAGREAPLVSVPEPATDAMARARELLHGSDPIANRARAYDLMLIACERGDRIGCEAVASAHYVADAVRVHARDRLWDLCERGDFASCRQADTHGFGLLDRAQLQRRCAAGFAAACTNLAELLPHSEQVLLERACRLGSESACIKVVARDPDAWVNVQRRWYIIGCDAGNADDCVNVASELHFSALAGAYYDRASELDNAHCLAGVNAACLLATSSDPVKKLSLRRMACVLNTRACHDYADLALSEAVDGSESAVWAYEASCFAPFLWDRNADDCFAGAKLARNVLHASETADKLQAAGCALHATDSMCGR